MYASFETQRWTCYLVICVNSSTNIARTHSHVLQDNCAFDNYKNEQVVFKAITFTNKATTCTHLCRPSLNINEMAVSIHKLSQTCTSQETLDCCGTVPLLCRLATVLLPTQQQLLLIRKYGERLHFILSRSHQKWYQQNTVCINTEVQTGEIMFPLCLRTLPYSPMQAQ